MILLAVTHAAALLRQRQITMFCHKIRIACEACG